MALRGLDGWLTHNRREEDFDDDLWWELWDRAEREHPTWTGLETEEWVNEQYEAEVRSERW